MNLVLLKQPLTYTLLGSVVLHIFILFGVGLALPDPRNFEKSLKPLEVVLVNSRSESPPKVADAFAQSNLNGGGNTEEDHRAKSPFPLLDDGKQFSPQQSVQRVRLLEREAKRLMTQIKSMHTVAPEKKLEHKPSRNSGKDLVERSLEIARLEAQVTKDYDAYQKLPRRRFIGARTREYRFAQYVEDWRIKVERIGNLNYPEAARQKHIFGSLVLTVSIRSDGHLDSVEVDRTSGKPVLDAAAMRIVKLAAPYAPFPPNIRKDTDIISITRTWTFTEANNMQSED